MCHPKTYYHPSGISFSVLRVTPQKARAIVNRHLGSRPLPRPGRELSCRDGVRVINYGDGLYDVTQGDGAYPARGA